MKQFIFIFSLFLGVYLTAQDLSSDFIYQGDEFIIYGIKPSSQDTITITKDEIARTHAKSLRELLLNHANLHSNSNGGGGTVAGAQIRGLSGSRVLVLINGVPHNSAQRGDSDLSTIELSQIEKIEIIEGGSDQKYAQSGAMGGVINIITRKKTINGFSIYGHASTGFNYMDFYHEGRGMQLGARRYSAWTDLFDKQHISTGFQVGNGRVSYNADASFNRYGNHFIFQDDYGIKRRQDNNTVLDGNFQNMIAITLPAFAQLHISGSLMAADRLVRGTMTSVNVDKQKDLQAKGQIAYKANLVGSERISTEAISDYDFSLMKWDSLTVHSLHALHKIYTVNRWDFQATDWLAINTGIDLGLVYVDSTEIGERFLYNGGTFVATEFNIHNKISLTPFMRIQYSKHYPVLIPKIAALVHICEDLVFKANFFRVFREPSVNDLYWPRDSFTQGNPDLKFEDGFGGDIIFEYHNAQLFTASSSIHANYIFNSIQWEPLANGIWTPTNVGEALLIGSGHRVQTLFNKYFYFTANYDFLLSYLLTKNTTFEDDKRMPYAPMHLFGFSVTADWQSGAITLSGNYLSERFTDSLNLGVVPEVFTLNLDINQTFNGFTWYISFKNMLNAFYTLIDGYPMPNGSIETGIKYNITKLKN